MFEQLESRRLFAVTAAVDVASGELRIVGDSANDNVQVSKLNATQIVVNDLTTAQSFTFNAAQVSKIRFEGNEGNDRFEMIQGTSATRRLDLPTVALGGAGDDTLITLGGNDKLDGGTGNDVLTAGAGDDSLVGGPGSFRDADLMDGQDGKDTVDYSARTSRVVVDLRGTISTGRFALPTFQGAARENDQIGAMENAIGGAGSDILIGNALGNNLGGNGGNDKIKGLGGADNVTGGDGNDSLVGGAGGDFMLGQAGDDLLSGGDGSDVMQGGAGNDILIGGSGRDAIQGDDGDDTIFAQDGQFEVTGGDLITGGNGNDSAETDANDAVQQVEELLA